MTGLLSICSLIVSRISILSSVLFRSVKRAAIVPLLPEKYPTLLVTYLPFAARCEAGQ
jgi:hypothetical protein